MPPWWQITSPAPHDPRADCSATHDALRRARQTSAVPGHHKAGSFMAGIMMEVPLPGALTLAYKCARPPWMAHLVSPGAAGSLHWLPFVVIAIHRQGSGPAGEDAICSSIR